MASYTHDIKDYFITIMPHGGTPFPLLEGGETDKFSYEKENDKFTKKTDVNGNIHWGVNPDECGSITIKTMQDSLINAPLQNLLASALQQVAKTPNKALVDISVIRKGVPFIQGINGRLTKNPAGSRGREPGETEWKFDFETLAISEIGLPTIDV